MTNTPDTPSGISAAVGALVVVVCCVAPPHLDAAGVTARLAVLALGLAAFSAAVVDVVATVATVGVAALLFDGFVLDRYGELAWHGEVDALRLAVLVGAALLGLAAGAARLAVRRRRPRAAGHARTGVPGPRTASEAEQAPRGGPRLTPRG